MGVINFDGLIKPTFFTSFQTGKVAGAHKTADENYSYYLANEAVFEFRLEVETPGGVVTVERHATEKEPLYDKDRPCYVCDPTPTAALEKLADAVKGNKLAKATLKSVKVWLKPFFLEMLKLMTRTDGTFSLARPDPASQKAIEDSFLHKFISDDQGVAWFPQKDDTKEIKEIPCDLSGVTVFPPKGSDPAPRVALSVIMRIKERLAAQDRDEVARIFMAADYTKIYKHAKTKGRLPWFGNPDAPGDPDKALTGDEVQLKQWETNVAHYLWNHSSLTRGAAIFKETFDAGVAAASAGKPAQDIVKVVRDEIDARLITANHWGQRREHRFKENYQRKLSDLFGTMHLQRFFMASPVAWLRNLADGKMHQPFLRIPPPPQPPPPAPPAKDSSLEFGEWVALSLQWGVGHCQEHGNAAFLVLKKIMEAGHGAKLGNIILTGNANVDHSFVVGGIKNPGLFKTKLSREFYSGAFGERLKVVDLKDALSKSSGDGFVCDPYLAPGDTATTCKGLLVKLNGNDRSARQVVEMDPKTGKPVIDPKTGKPKLIAVDARTDFIRYVEQHPGPEPPDPTFDTLGLRGL